MMLKIGYIGLTALMIIVLWLMGQYAINKSYESAIAIKKVRIVIGGLMLWQFYIWFLSKTGTLENLEFPPRFALFMIIPAFIFTGIFIWKNKNLSWIQAIPPHWLIYYQSFRVLVESLFVFSVVENILHPNVTIEGYNYDMVFAFTALIVGYLLKSDFPKYRKLAIGWNYFGLVVIAFIIFLFQATLYSPEIFGNELVPFPTEAVKYPYILVAGFLMPSAVFIHVLSIVQLSRRLM